MFLFLAFAYSEFCCWCWITHLKIAHCICWVFLCAFCVLHWQFLTWCFIYIHVNIFTDPVTFFFNNWTCHKVSIYSYICSNVFQPRSTQWSSYCKKMMTPLTRSSWGVWWKVLKWMMCMDQWVRYWRGSTSGHILKDRGKTTSVPSWSRIGQ